MRRPSTVILLHGLARTAGSVSTLRKHVAAAGYSTWARSYPSRRQSIAQLAEGLAARIRAEVGDEELMAVTHSLGGVVLRHLAVHLPFRRVVMIAPPNQGSRVARALRDQPLFKWFYGPAGQELGDPSEWPLPSGEVGVIAGTRGHSPANPVGWVTRAFLPADAPSDGTVAVEETRLPGMAAFRTVPASHSRILRDPSVRSLVVSFLAHGRFDGP